ncbi:MAG: hypothetical protein P1P88_08045, partial [Bacteroidales bacterium]|nr:hypothetical protein [Bacteroidales bacterium]
MTAEQIKISIETRELQLTNRQKLIHYKVVILLLFIGIIGLFFSLKEYISGTYNLFIYAGIGFFIFSVIIFSTLGTSWADEIIESINEASEYYKEGDYSEAVSSLDYASQLIR